MGNFLPASDRKTPKIDRGNAGADFGDVSQHLSESALEHLGLSPTTKPISRDKLRHALDFALGDGLGDLIMYESAERSEPSAEINEVPDIE